MLDALKVLLDNIETILRSFVVVASLWTIGKVAFKTSFALISVAGVIFVVFLVNWAMGNFEWARNLLNRDAQKLGMSAVTTTFLEVGAVSDMPESIEQLLRQRRPADPPRHQHGDQFGQDSGQDNGHARR